MLSGEAQVLKSLVSQFKLRNTGMAGAVQNISNAAPLALQEEKYKKN